tara:strand:- start:296 stop:553 length:258 start_codon:yes stop_codon:yes gene_type:complete
VGLSTAGQIKANNKHSRDRPKNVRAPPSIPARIIETKKDQTRTEEDDSTKNFVVGVTWSQGVYINIYSARSKKRYSLDRIDHAIV